jgi:hypothetical protein
MELCHSLEANSCSATQEIPSILQNPEVHYCVQSSPTTGPYPEPDKSSPQPQPISLRSILILSPHLCLSLPSSLFPSGFPIRTKALFSHDHVCYMPCPFQPP